MQWLSLPSISTVANFGVSLCEWTTKITFRNNYRISGNIDSDFNLADRFSIVKLKFAITYNLPIAIQALMLC